MNSLLWTTDLSSQGQLRLIICTSHGLEIRSPGLAPLASSSFGEFLTAAIYRSEVIAIKCGYKVLNADLYSKILRPRKTLLQELQPTGPFCFSPCGEVYFCINLRRRRLKVYSVNPFSVRNLDLPSSIAGTELMSIYAIDSDRLLIWDEAAGLLMVSTADNAIMVLWQCEDLKPVCYTYCTDRNRIYAIVNRGEEKKLIEISMEG